MKGIRFYLEYDTKKAKRLATVKSLGAHTGNVLASYVGQNDGLAGLFEYPNSPVTTVVVDPLYLQEKCKRIPEHIAKEIHPNLFARLTDD